MREFWILSVRVRENLKHKKQTSQKIKLNLNQINIVGEIKHEFKWSKFKLKKKKKEKKSKFKGRNFKREKIQQLLLLLLI